MGKDRDRTRHLNEARHPAIFRGLPAVIACIALSLSAACTTTVVPPAEVNRPQPVFVLDHGHHSSLVVPHPDGLVRYAYGDWAWYAEMQTGPLEAVRAVFWPTPAGLGRRLVPGTPTSGGVRQAVAVGIEHLHEIRVDADRVDRLRASLDAVYRANASRMRHNPYYGLTFVPHPDPYTFRNNSNRRVAQWLRELGCSVRGSALWARWEVTESGASTGDN